MKAIAAMLVIAMLAVGPLAGAASTTEERTPYEVLENTIRPYLVPGSNPRLDDTDGQGTAEIVQHFEMGDEVLVLVRCISVPAPELFCTGDVVTEVD